MAKIAWSDEFKARAQLGLIDDVKPWSAMGEREGTGVTAAGEEICRLNDLNDAPTSDTFIPWPADAGCSWWGFLVDGDAISTV